MEGYEAFKAKVLKKTHLDLSLYKEKQMKRRIISLIRRNQKDSFDAYFRMIDSDEEAFNEFINYLTINVSEFYRNPNQWEVLEKEVYPALLAHGRKLKIWSAACSTGEEPYSLVMSLSRHLPLRDIEIYAVDFDEEAMNKARLGVYSAKSIANVPDSLKSKFFEAVGPSFKITDEIKSRVTFKRMNLLKDPYPSGFDLIVCRNVMIYFTEEAKDEMYKKFNGSLREGGIFFVGSTEQIISPQKYQFESMRTFFYKKNTSL